MDFIVLYLLGIGAIATLLDFKFSNDSLDHSSSNSKAEEDEADDYVLATGETHTVRSFVDAAFKAVDMDIEWRGEGVDEKGYVAGTDRCLVEVDPRYFRPTEVDLLIGDPTKAREKLGWSYTTTLAEMVSEMVQSDLKVVQSETNRKDRHG